MARFIHLCLTTLMLHRATIRRLRRISDATHVALGTMAIHLSASIVKSLLPPTAQTSANSLSTLESDVLTRQLSLRYAPLPYLRHSVLGSETLFAATALRSQLSFTASHGWTKTTNARITPSSASIASTQPTVVRTHVDYTSLCLPSTDHSIVADSSCSCGQCLYWTSCEAPTSFS
jgi:hypothetical protein